LYTKPVFELIELLDQAGCRLMIQMRYEDERDRYFALNVYGPKIDQVVRLADRFSESEILCLNCYLTEAQELGQRTSNVSVDIAFAEWLFTMSLLLEDFPPERVYFGSHTPLLITKATVMKLTESEIDAGLKTQIGSENARRFLGR
jgi:predicted TIM-barrel fold metal-dependent hydrolase